MIMPKPLSATRIGALAALVLAAACTDRTPTDPAGTLPAGREMRTEIACTVSVADGAVRCGDPAPAGGASQDLILGGQGTYVRLASANAGRDDATGEFAVDVTVQNLLSLQMGTPDGTTATGVRVFFEQMPTATAGSGEVTVANADGTGTFTRVGQPYFAYPAILEPRGSSAPRTWRFAVPDGVTRFGFTVYVHTALPAEQGVLRWLQEEGPAWTPLTQVRALWGTSPNDVFAVGLSGRILHFDGARWTAMRSGTGAGLLGVWGTSRHDVYAVGDSGTVLRYDGNRWNRLAGPVANRFLRTLWGRGDTLWIAGFQRDANARSHGLVMRSVNGGATWSETFSTAASGNRQLWGITGTSGGALVVTGLQFGTADGHNDAVILRSTNGGDSWTEQEVVSEPSARHLYRVWAQGEHVFAVGERSSETIAGFEGFTMRSADGGVTWTRESHAAPLSLYGVWGSAPDDVTAVGPGGVLRYDGTGWTAVNPGGANDAFHAVWGSSAGTVFAAGNNQLMARRTEGAWALTPYAGDFDHNYVAVWGAGTNGLYAVARVYDNDVNSWGTALLHRTAQGWTTVRPWEANLELMGIWGTGTGIVIVSGFRYNANTGRYEGVILRNGGSGWTETVRVMGDGTRFNAVHGDGAGNVWIAGNAN
ncbi:MAG TPA: hypothetical protein VE871_19475, partial [Longimicrobium sp.]|nr:hypothetical protein [Longimicrobium sp.]